MKILEKIVYYAGFIHAGGAILWARILDIFGFNRQAINVINRMAQKAGYKDYKEMLNK